MPDGPIAAFIPVPLSLLILMRLPSMPARATAICWLAFLEEVENARREHGYSSRAIPVSYLPSDGFRRGGTRAFREIAEIIALAERDFPERLFAEAPCIVGNPPILSWRLSEKVRSKIVTSFRLDRRRVTPFVRIELATAMYAKTRWTMPVYAALGRRIIARRSAADLDGWVGMAIPLRELAEEIGWTGHQLKDLRRKVIAPALTDLGLNNADSEARPRFLDLRSEPITRGTLAIAGRRIGRTGLALDSAVVREKLRANRGRLGDLPPDVSEDENSETAQPPSLRQGIVW